MNLNIDKEIIEKPLSQIIGVVEKRQTLPILGNVYLQVENNKLTLVGSDLETELTTRVDNIFGDEGSTTVSARKLHDICKSLPNDAKLSLQVQDNQMSVTAGKSRFTLQTLDAAEYPRLTETDWKHEFQISHRDLHRLFMQTAFCMAQQDVRYFLNGLLIELKAGQIISVATDGHRLAKSQVELPESDIDGVQSIIPRKAVLEVSRVLKTDSDDLITVRLNASHVQILSDNFSFISKLIDGRFPDYEKVIPGNLDKHVILNRLDFIDVLQRAAILSNEKFRGVALKVENNLLTVASHNPEQEHARDELEVNYVGDPIEIGFNVNYLLEALRANSADQIDLGLHDPNTSCTFHSEGNDATLYLIMPMRL
jgi:DNA polymerase-3 subunit beta